ncbi:MULTISPECIES: DUF6527 family protein [Streptomyces]|uniref:DUF6527 family protein n=1 Tax=Streptomyces plicatus TaxID=1922 RepID=A0ABW1Y6V7_STRPL|nr:hypothetical protein D3C59_17275 [Streptomyces sp. SHP22-7]RSS66309.1 hypothetical protein EF907_16275 [Streptomyces sp. WAC06273]GGZ73370.1 hypothetical protein GCM10010301_53790 [Streptomyces plicatus]GHC27610.1 hypothetical protein GCM10010308_50770 [Streptomyces vinaceusdrappus]
MKPVRLTHEFVHYIPEKLDTGVLYVSLPFTTVIHLCCCGCGSQVVTPLSPTDWRLTFDGASISLNPSIGNWSYPCQSHYWIRDSMVHWAERWTPRQIEAARARDGRSDQRQSTPQRGWPRLARFVQRMRRWLRQ